VSWRELLEIAGVPALRIERSFEPQGALYPYTATCATVSVDTGTGEVRPLSIVVAADVGTILNRGIVEGQIAGAAVQAIGGALLEELRYTEDGQPQSTTLVDYLLPTAADVPEVAVRLLDQHPSPLTPLGAKGAGEVGILGVAPAIANAVAAALRPARVEPNAIPLTPERVLRLIAGVEVQP
jgi:CO/xanthine dehydrogenase Mo-binding subunit